MSSSLRLVCATRASRLALIQARSAIAALEPHGIAAGVLPLTTTGDRMTDRPIAAIGSDNIFVSELEEALREGRADFAVHSCKDLPSTLPDDMMLTAVGPRADVRDAFCSERWPAFAALPPGSRVGTSSERRRAQLLALRPDLRYDDIRGNVDTRLRKLRAGEYDALVLAMAGMQRLGQSAQHTVPFSPAELTPAAGQGALAIETLKTCAHAALLRSAFNHGESETCVLAERAFLRALHAGCRSPVGTYAQFAGGDLELSGVAAGENGGPLFRNALRMRLSAEAPDELGRRLAETVLSSAGLKVAQ